MHVEDDSGIGSGNSKTVGGECQKSRCYRYDRKRSPARSGDNPWGTVLMLSCGVHTLKESDPARHWQGHFFCIASTDASQKSCIEFKGRT